MLTFVSHLQDDLSAPSELSASNDNLSENNNTKVRFLKARHLNPRVTQYSKMNHNSNGSNNIIVDFILFSQEKGGIFSGVFRKKVAKSQSRVRRVKFANDGFSI